MWFSIFKDCELIDMLAPFVSIYTFSMEDSILEPNILDKKFNIGFDLELLR